MTETAPRPLTGLELARAALVGLSAGIAAGPLLAAIDLPAQPEGLAPLAPAWVARGGSAGLLVGLACLALPRLLRRGPIDPRRVRSDVGRRLTALAGIGGGVGIILLFLGALPENRGGAVMGLLVSPCAAVVTGAAAGLALGGRHGRARAARWGAGVGLATYLFGLGSLCAAGTWFMTGGGALGRELAGTVALGLTLCVFPSLLHPGDAFEPPR